MTCNLMLYESAGQLRRIASGGVCLSRTLAVCQRLTGNDTGESSRDHGVWCVMPDTQCYPVDSIDIEMFEARRKFV